jgi:hypothetical protein
MQQKNSKNAWMSWKHLDLWTDGETEKNEKHIDSTQTDRQTSRDKNDWHRFVKQINLKDDKENRQTDRHKDRQTETGKSYDQPMCPKW